MSSFNSGETRGLTQSATKWWTPYKYDKYQDEINNYFEKLVTEHIQDRLNKNELEQDDDFLSDVACVALNQLPSRYVRHNVDMVFYMTIDEREQYQEVVEEAVLTAIEYVNKHRHNDRPETINQ